jgi:hypothetical protein
VSLLLGTPREVYRVYGQDEFLAGADESPQDAAASPSRESGVRRVAAAGALLAVLGAAGALLALGARRPAGVTARRPQSAARREPVRSAATRVEPVVPVRRRPSRRAGQGVVTQGRATFGRPPRGHPASIRRAAQPSSPAAAFESTADAPTNPPERVVIETTERIARTGGAVEFGFEH